MSDVQTRGSSSRGRGSYRGGRGGYRGARGAAKPHSKHDEQEQIQTQEEQGEVGELKAKYGDKLPLLREVCEGWSDEDLVFALQETNGDVEAALDRITSGTISQWGEVKKKPVKAKESASLSTDANSRGRSRGGFESRGRGRGSGTERVARAGRGGRAVSQTNGTKSTEKLAKSTDETHDDATQAPVEASTANGEPATEVMSDLIKEKPVTSTTNTPKSGATQASSGARGGWASLFAKPTPAPAPVKAPAPEPVPVSTPASASVPVAAPEEPTPISAPVVESIPEPVLPPIEPVHVDDPPSELPSAPASENAPELTPSKDELTEKNLDKIPDVSQPLATQTVASTTASTQDPMNPAVPIAPVIRPGMSGYAASALKATSGGRAASYSRKLMEQQEAVVMPGNHAVDRTAVQFGKMGLDSDEDLDADEEREEPETRTQLPDDSPAAPRASLPPAVPETKAPVEAAADEPSGPRLAPGLPPAPTQAQPPSPQQSSAYADQYRYGQGNKSYDPFTQPPPQGPATTEAFSNQIPGQTQGGPAAAQDYSQYYANNRDAYQQQYYGGAYGQGHETHRSGSAFGTSAQDTQGQYATARPQQGYGQQESQNSGNNTPNPPASGHQPQHSQQLPGQGNHGGYYAGYPNAYAQQYPGYSASYMAGMSQRYGANRPMFDDVRRDNDYYGGHAGYNHSHQYGSSYKSNMYGQPHQYSHDYSSSPANNSGFGGRDAAYGRASSTQPSEGQQSAATNNAFAGMADPFGRTPSGFGQSQGHSTHQASDDAAKASGPSPSLQGNRPGSAVNNASNQQSALPHPQAQHSSQGFSGYPQYGGFGNQTHQNSGYGAYGSNASFGGYGGGYGRGWSGNYSGGHN